VLSPPMSELASERESPIAWAVGLRCGLDGGVRARCRSPYDISFPVRNRRLGRR